MFGLSLSLSRATVAESTINFGKSLSLRNGLRPVLQRLAASTQTIVRLALLEIACK
jgi:hypothetical protein